MDALKKLKGLVSDDATKLLSKGIETLTEKEGAVQFDLPRIRGGFTDKLNADGAELAGEWTQGGRTTPLVFKRLPAKS